MVIKDSWIIGVFSAVAVLGMAAMAWQFRERTLTGYNDFIQLYSGARLVGTPGLYNTERVSELQMQAVGVTGESWRYTRLPYYAALLWPLGKLPYRTAYLIWELLAGAALVGFVVLWREPSVSVTVLFTSLNLPAFAGLMNGQDVTFLLLWIAIAAALERKGKPFAAGLVFALCGAKYHLFLLAPLLMLGKRTAGKPPGFAFVWGLLAGAGALAVGSFAVAGLSWPAEYLAVLRDPRVRVLHMPNLRGLFAALAFVPFTRWLQWPGAAAVAAAVWVVVRRASFEYGLAAVLIGGLLVSYHASLPDCSVVLPGALILIARTTLPLLRYLAFIALIPVSYFLLLIDSPLTAAIPLLFLAMVALMVVETVRAPVAAQVGEAQTISR